jgi:hypothetical protein
MRWIGLERLPYSRRTIVGRRYRLTTTLLGFRKGMYLEPYSAKVNKKDTKRA